MITYELTSGLGAFGIGAENMLALNVRTDIVNIVVNKFLICNIFIFNTSNYNINSNHSAFDLAFLISLLKKNTAKAYNLLLLYLVMA